jgi:SNF family Na+-dependent transporter
LGLGFKTLPYLFTQWGPLMGAVAGICWFGLLFFAGITSSLAMGTPVMAFLRDEFGWKRGQSAWAFGLIVLVLGAPTVFFFNEGVFDEYDYWAGTVSLVVFAFFEVILFAWVFGMDRGWKEINEGADMRIPVFFRWVIQYITPAILFAVLMASMPDIVSKIQNPGNPYIVGARILLLALYVGIAYAVYVAYRRRVLNTAKATPNK